MSMRPFMSYPESDYAAHWLKILGKATHQPVFAHVNWFARDDEDGHFLWPGYRDNLRALLWLLDLKDGRVTGRSTPVGIVPEVDELNLDGFEGSRADLEKILTIDRELWVKELDNREEYLNQFHDLPDEIWEAHRRICQNI